MSKTISEWDREVWEHYQKFWGSPARIEEFRPQNLKAPNPVFVLEFSPSSIEEDWVYATIGASRQMMPNTEGQNSPTRVELFMYCRRRQPKIGQVLAGLASYPFLHETSFSVGDTIRGDEAIVEDTRLSDFLLTHPYFEKKELSVIHHANGIHTRLLWAIPIYASENQLIQSHGSDALEDLFREQQTDTSDFMRSPVT